MDPLASTSPLETLGIVEEQRYHSVTNELFTEVALDPERTLFAVLFENGTMILRRGDVCLVLDEIETMHLGNAILARSQQSEAYLRIAKILESEGCHE